MFLLGACAGPREPLVAVGLEHTCALEAGALRCWGAGGHGQRGADLASLPALSSLDSGGNTTCALTDEGEVFCFGQGHRAQLGDGSLEDSATPRRVRGLPVALEVSVGFAHACARGEDGVVCCWGWNGSGQSDPDDPSPEVRTPMCRALDARRVHAGFDTTCVIDGAQRLSCFGAMRTRGEGVHDVALGADHVCLLRADSLTCHGASPGGAGELLEPPLVMAFDGGRLAAGAIDHLCVSDAAGALHCMGKNEQGQLGDRSFGAREAPARVVDLPSPVRSVGVGDRHTCAVASGEVWCWGWNDEGQLGDDTGVHSLEPIVVARRDEED